MYSFIKECLSIWLNLLVDIHYAPIPDSGESLNDLQILFLLSTRLLLLHLLFVIGVTHYSDYYSKNQYLQLLQQAFLLSLIFLMAQNGGPLFFLFWQLFTGGTRLLRRGSWLTMCCQPRHHLVSHSACIRERQASREHAHQKHTLCLCLSRACIRERPGSREHAHVRAAHTPHGCMHTYVDCVRKLP